MYLLTVFSETYNINCSPFSYVPGAWITIKAAAEEAWGQKQVNPFTYDTETETEVELEMETLERGQVHAEFSGANEFVNTHKGQNSCAEASQIQGRLGWVFSQLKIPCRFMLR